ncbi:MAG: Holliday junction branch migration protein RuvA [Nitrospinota bacterium]|nr:Holliday junction branch migration protein RuvA [Nitrospinota bacterium]
MIARLTGTIASKKPTHTVVETGGVGYLVSITLPTFTALPGEGERVSLFIHTKVSDEAIQLFGFTSQTELDLFKKLMTVSKVGPKLAMSVLSGIPARELVAAVRAKDGARFAGVPGVGAKTASRILLELSDKLEGILDAEFEPDAPATGSSLESDAVEALVSLGYKPAEARKAVKSAMSADPSILLEDIVKAALARMA